MQAQINAALAAQVKQTGAELKAADAATAESEKSFAAAKREAAGLKSKLDEMRQSVHQHREALRAQGVDVGNLAAEYTRLKREAEAANAAQAQKSALAQDRETLGIAPHADTQDRIAAIHAAVERLRASGTLTFVEMAQAELKANEMAQELAHQLNGVGESLSALQDDLIEFGAALAAVYATADQAVRFESGFAGVAKVVDASTTELAALSDELLKMTRNLPNAASEMLSIAESAGSLGIAADEVGAFTEGVAKLSSAFKMQAAETADYVAGIKNGFGLSVAQALELGDAVNTLGNRYAATENDILNVDARIAASAKTFGLSAEQASALATTLLSLKQPPEVAATAINGLLSRLQSARVQSPEFIKSLRAIGVDANQLANDIAAHPQQALDGFLETLAELDNASLAEATNQLIGQGGDATALQQLVQNLKQYKESVGIATDKTQTAGAVEREFAAQMATTDAQLKLVKNSVVELAVNVGDTLLPAITGSANGVQTFINALADAAKANPELIKLLAIFTPLIAGAGLLNGIGLRLAVMWGMVRAAFAAGGAASAAMSGGLGTVLAAVLRLIGGPIGLLILGLTTLADWWGRNKDKAIAWGDESVTVAEIVRTAWGYLMRAADALGAYLAAQFGKMGADVDRYAQGVKGAVNFVIGVFAGLGNGIGEGLAVFVEDVRRYFAQAVKLAQAAGNDIQAATRLDFSGANVKAQWAANAAENKAAEVRQNHAGFGQGFGVAFDAATQGDAVGSGIKSVMFTAGQAVTDWTSQWRGEFRAQMAKDQAKADAEAEAKKSAGSDSGGTGGAGPGGQTGGGRRIDWNAAGGGGSGGSGGSGGGKSGGGREKSPEQTAGEEIDALNQGLAERRLAFEKTHLLLEFSKQEEKAYWDEVITNFKGSSVTLSQLKERSARLDVDIQRDAAREQQAVQTELSQAQQAAALSDLDFKRQMADQELELGGITKEQHLARLKELAAQELQLRLKMLENRRLLNPNDPVEQAQITAQQQQVMIEFRGQWGGLELDGIKAAKDQIAGIFAPLQNAIDQSVNGILTGQQTIANAARNAAQSIVVSYLQQSIKTRAIAAGDWLFQKLGMAQLLGEKKQLDLLGLAWDGMVWVKRKAVHAAGWLWETLGFGAKEATKTGIKVTSETTQAGVVAASETVKAGAVVVGEAVQTGAVAAGESARSGITLMGTIKTIGAKAAQAAAGAFSWVMTAVPWPLNLVLAPIAAAGAFLGTMAFAAFSARGGEWQVGEDGAPYILHKRESVLPAGVADNFRTVVEIVRDYAAPPKAVVGGAVAAIEAGTTTGRTDGTQASTTSRVSEAVASTTSRVSEFASAASSRVSEAVSSTSSRVSEFASAASSRVSEAVSSTSSRVSEFASAASSRVSEAVSSTAPTGAGGTILPPNTSELIANMVSSGEISANWRIPAAVLDIPRQSEQYAQSLVASRETKDGAKADQASQLVAATRQAVQTAAQSRRRDELRIHTVSAKDLFSENSRVIVRQLAKEARRFNKGE